MQQEVSTRLKAIPKLAAILRNSATVMLMAVPMVLAVAVVWLGLVPDSDQEGNPSETTNPSRAEISNATRVVGDAAGSSSRPIVAKSLRRTGLNPDGHTRAKSRADGPGYESVAARESQKDDRMSMPDWARIFEPGGALRDSVGRGGVGSRNGIPDYVDLYGALRAEFIQDNISNGQATDMSALLDAVRISDEVLYNGAVSAAHDVGNAYFMADRGPEGQMRLYLGIERLFVPVDSYIEIEFNQVPVRLGSGTNWWDIQGEREDGDLLVRLNFRSGRLADVEFETWQGSAFDLVDEVDRSPGRSCIRETAFVYCEGEPPLGAPAQGVQLWDTNFKPVTPTPPSDFVQVGVDLMRLTGSNQDFSGVLIRTPEDIAINGFQRAGDGRRPRIYGGPGGRRTSPGQ
jgi:hypothetical protein